MLEGNIQTLADLLAFRSQQINPSGHYTFLEDGEQLEKHLSYQQLFQKAQQISYVLNQYLLEKEPILLLLNPSLDFINSFFGCVLSKGIPVPAMIPRRKGALAILENIVKNAKIRFCITQQQILSRIQKWQTEDSVLSKLQFLPIEHMEEAPFNEWQPSKISPFEPALIQYTSGSTAHPKGVLISHDNILHNAGLISRLFGHSQESRGVIWLPPYHDMGLMGGIIQPLFANFPVVLMSPLHFIQRPLRWLQAISRYEATISGGPDFSYALCANKIALANTANIQLNSWEVAFTGGEPVKASTLNQFVEAFTPLGFQRKAFLPCYGMAESTLIASGSSKDALPIIKSFDSHALAKGYAKLASGEGKQMVGCGNALEDMQLHIIHPQEGTICKEGEVGEICIAGPSICQGYFGLSAKNTQWVDIKTNKQGSSTYIATGDLGFLWEGQLFISGRKKNIIIIRGQNYYPQDIEESVEQSHPALELNGGAAFTITQAEEEALVLVQCINRHHLKTVQNEIFQSIQVAVSQRFGLAFQDIVLLKPHSLPKTSSGKKQRLKCRALYLKNLLPSLNH